MESTTVKSQAKSYFFSSRLRLVLAALVSGSFLYFGVQAFNKPQDKVVILNGPAFPTSRASIPSTRVKEEAGSTSEQNLTKASTGPVSSEKPEEETQTLPANTSANFSAKSSNELNEVLEPYELSKNPYKWKGHSGILDTITRPMFAANGVRFGKMPWGSVTFQRMIDEHTAIYRVEVEGEASPEQLAVLLPDSEPPVSRRLWKVIVEGPLEGLNGLGERTQVTAVRFEGYYDPPQNQSLQN